MAKKKQEAAEVDYLVPAQLTINPSSFAQAVKEAFLLEHDCLEHQDIAAVLGVDKSRVSQIFKHPRSLKAETVKGLLDQLQSARHKKRILRAWIQESVGIDIAAKAQGQLAAGAASERTLRRVDRQVRQLRLSDAADLSLEAANKTEDWILRQQFLDRAYFVRQRLDLPGSAMVIARRVATDATTRGDAARIGGAYYMRARILLGLPDSTPEQLEQVLRETASFVSHAQSGEFPPYITATTSTVASLRRSALITFMERGRLKPTETLVREQIASLLSDITKRGLSYQNRFHLHLLLARCHLLVGETFQAQERIDQAYASGKLKNLHSLEFCALIETRALATSEAPEAISQRLQVISRNCSHAMDLDLRRAAEADLARVESLMFATMAAIP